MYVCLCVGATSQQVTEAIAQGASTLREVAAVCGTGKGCGRCCQTIRAIITSTQTSTHTAPVNHSRSDRSSDTTCPPHSTPNPPCLTPCRVTRYLTPTPQDVSAGRL